jgi:hypothetical protein
MTSGHLLGVKHKYDFAYSNFGAACTGCGGAYGTSSLAYASACGGYDGMPRADGGDGMDHRQLLVDLVVEGTGGTCAHEPWVSGAALANGCSACLASVCAVDSYCCTTSWDSLCVSRANQRCTACSHSTDVTGAPPLQWLQRLCDEGMRGQSCVLHEFLEHGLRGPGSHELSLRG